ncbi:nucleotide exchange factor GrpE [Kocuria sp. JC486]|uniref:Protein GrpE n=1 Tax=Kocuria soli TaxID=2485125 RepID=A0A3N3ZW66_9MICC|nr:MULTISPECIES: nucleotide exchange factor GrpE [Kocuria]NHU85030.1 nucleotide exchange factor GrpE [Kocuria sp. JC486]ROZ65623.1 nucleotide exchange factor GrpE [Kocuria soli]
MSTSPEEPQNGEPQDQAADQESPLTAEEILNAEQTEDARAADHDPAVADPESTGDSELAQLAEDRLDDLRRLQAEFLNYKNRTDRERTQLRDHVVGEVLGSLLPVFDDIDAARAAGDLADGPFAAIATKLESLLDKQGLERIGEIGEAFDPNVHEAVLQQPAEGVEADHISMVLRSGFRVGTRVVRAAQVAVAP